LDEKEKDIIVGAMEEKKYKKGEVVINQGDEGKEMYMVESGELDC
jgi:cAMP-dependent protein kinase regulator